ncbi:MAG: hypothetical protein L0H83_09410 [Salinisphaera sp.]|nr:hypothetical protein [Salinisphaera sp.]
MRLDTIAMVIAMAVVAAGTWFLLETFVPKPEPQLAAVVPAQPPVVHQDQAVKRLHSAAEQPSDHQSAMP